MKYSSDYLIYPPYSDKMREIKNELNIDYIDVFLTAIAIGINENKKSTFIKENTDTPITIPRNVLFSRKQKIELLVRVAAIKEYNDKLEQKDFLKHVYSEEDQYAILRQKVIEEYFATGFQKISKLYEGNSDSFNIYNLIHEINE